MDTKDFFKITNEKILLSAYFLICIFVVAFLLLTGEEINFPHWYLPPPEKYAIEDLNDAIATPYTPRSSFEISWKKDYALSARGLAEGTGEIDEEHICLSYGDFDDVVGWGTTYGNIVQYTGTARAETKIAAYCGICSSKEPKGLDIEAGTKLNATLDTSKCNKAPFITGDDQNCCIIALMKV